MPVWPKWRALMGVPSLIRTSSSRRGRSQWSSRTLFKHPLSKCREWSLPTLSLQSISTQLRTWWESHSSSSHWFSLSSFILSHMKLLSSQSCRISHHSFRQVHLNSLLAWMTQCLRTSNLKDSTALMSTNFAMIMRRSLSKYSKRKRSLSTSIASTSMRWSTPSSRRCSCWTKWTNLDQTLRTTSPNSIAFFSTRCKWSSRWETRSLVSTRTWRRRR